ncbi:MAG: hypothetical protein IPJ77_01540 [Planctomycetes bacterium]|nr:hypothetical protein [Planctomycetota bacterium]
MSSRPEHALTRGERAWPWVEGALLALVVLLVLAFAGDAVRASYHGYLHVTVGEAVLRDGLVPENPYHAGAPLRYYTLYPALGVLLGRTGIGPLWGFVVLNVLAAFLLAPALDAAGRACGLGFVARRAAFLAAVLGFNALGWTGYLTIDATQFGRAPVYALSPLCWAGHPFGWDGRLHAFLPKFLNVSSFALALPFALWALSAAFGAPSSRRIALAGLALGVSTALNPLAGAVAGACLAVAAVPDVVRGNLGKRAAWGASAALAAAASAPFLLPALQPAPRGPSLTGNPDLGGSPVANLLGPLALLLPLALLGLAQLERPTRWRLAFAAGLCAVLVLVGEMPQGNEYKLERMLALVLALPAGALAGAWWTSGALGRRKALACVVVALPTFAVVPWAYLVYGARAPALPLSLVERGRLLPEHSAQTTLPWVLAVQGRFTDRRAVVVLSHDELGSRLDAGLVQGNALAPALDRPLFVDLPQIHNEGQPDLERRLDLVAALYRGEAFRARDGAVRSRAAALAELRGVLPDRPLLVYVDDADAETGAALLAVGAKPGWAEGGCALYSLPALASAVREER